MSIFIPNGYSNATFGFTIPSGGGLKQASFSIGVQAPPDITLAANLMQAYIDEVWQPAGSSSATLQSVTVVDGLDGLTYESPTPGGRAYAPITPNVSLLVHKRSSRRGRKFQGRMFPPAIIGEETVDPNGAIKPTDLPDYQDLFVGFWDAIVALTGEPPVIFHQSESPIPTLINSFGVDPLVSTQRRRLR